MDVASRARLDLFLSSVSETQRRQSKDDIDNSFPQSLKQKNVKRLGLVLCVYQNHRYPPAISRGVARVGVRVLKREKTKEIRRLLLGQKDMFDNNHGYSVYGSSISVLFLTVGRWTI